MFRKRKDDATRRLYRDRLLVLDERAKRLAEGEKNLRVAEAELALERENFETTQAANDGGLWGQFR